MEKYQVSKFTYNGFFVNFHEGLADYTATFKNWTTDPGIANCNCSDGKERLIPSCCLIGFESIDYPLQTYTNKQLLGKPSQS